MTEVNEEMKEETLEDIMNEDVQEDVVEEKVEEAPEENTEETQEEKAEDEDERQKKQEAYRERQRKKAEEKRAQLERYDNVVDEAVDNIDEDEQKAAIEFVKSFRQNQEYVVKLNRAEKELNALEVDFKEAFTDYDDVVNEALEFSEMRLVSQGINETEAKEMLRREKILIADRAAAMGKDPVEAVYNEAKSIMSLIDKYVEKKGYKKDVRPKTNLEAIREISKPNAMTGGKGRGATVQTKSFDEMDSIQDIGEVTLGELMAQNS